MNLINGLPAHILLVHVVVVLVPLSALALVVCAAWPGGARRLGLVLPILALVTLVSVPLTMQAGDWLQNHVNSDPLVRAHTALGDTLLPWVLGLFVLSAAVWWTARRPAGAQGVHPGVTWVASTPVRAAAVALSLAIAIGSVVDVYQIGDSGAKAAWHDSFQQTAVHNGG